MSNFCPERIFRMLDSPIPGLDHLRAINPAAPSSACLDTDSDILNLPRLSSALSALIEANADTDNLLGHLRNSLP